MLQRRFLQTSLFLLLLIAFFSINTLAANAQNNTIVCIGDSITYGTINPGTAEYSYPEILQSNLTEWTVLNKGVPGDNSSQLLARWNTDVTALNPKYVVILVGINEIGFYTGAESNINRMVKWSLDNGTIPVICKILPNPLYKNEINAYNAWLDTYAANHNLPIIDFYTTMDDPANPGQMRSTDTIDNLHPNQTGYYRMVTAIDLSIFNDQYLIIKTDSGNLVSNPSFETSAASWALGGCVGTRTTDWANSGIYSYNLSVNTGTPTSVTAYYTDANLPKNNYSFYTIKAYFKTGVLPASNKLVLQFSNASWAEASTASVLNIASNTETSLTIETKYFNVVNNGIIVAGQLTSGTYPTGTYFYMDNVSVIQTNYSITFAPYTYLAVNATNISVGESVQFTSNSTDATSWLYDFGDGTNSTEQNPIHTYNTSGMFTVNLTATNPAGNHSEELTMYVAPIANFSASALSGINNRTITYTDLSAGSVDNWLWDFGDGQTSTEQNPTHTYDHGDNYRVSLTVSNYGGSNTITQTILVYGDMARWDLIGGQTKDVVYLLLIIPVALIGYFIIRLFGNEDVDGNTLIMVAVFALVIIITVGILLAVLGALSHVA